MNKKDQFIQRLIVHALILQDEMAKENEEKQKLYLEGYFDGLVNVIALMTNRTVRETINVIDESNALWGEVRVEVAKP